MAKKDFKAGSNPAMQFISKESIEKKAQDAGQLPADPIGKAIAGSELPEGYKIVEESKTRRLQALITPTTHRKLKRIADRREISVNEALNIALKEFIEREGE